jgi:hypothetical protein
MPDRSIPNGNASSPRDQLLKPAQVAEHLGVSVGWVYEHSTGDVSPVIPNFKLGKYRRFRMRDIERFIDEHASGRKPESPGHVLPAQSIAVRQAKATKKQKGA